MELKDKIIKKVIKDKSYADYLIGENLSDIRTIELICCAPVSLFQKAKWLKELSKTQTVDTDKEFYQYTSYAYYYDVVIDAIKELTAENLFSEGKVFILVGHSLEHGEDTQFECSPFNGYSHVTEYMDELFDKNGDYAYDKKCCWYILEKWVPMTTKKKLYEQYSFVLVGKQACYFTRYEWPADSFLLRHCTHVFDIFHSACSLNLPTPFKPGDVLEIDGRPFAPKTTVTVADNLNPYDCCSPFCEYIGKDGKKKQGALKHNHIYKESIFDCVSPLYTLKLRNKAKNEKS